MCKRNKKEEKVFLCLKKQKVRRNNSLTQRKRTLTLIKLVGALACVGGFSLVGFSLVFRKVRNTQSES